MQVRLLPAAPVHALQVAGDGLQVWQRVLAPTKNLKLATFNLEHVTPKMPGGVKVARRFVKPLVLVRVQAWQPLPVDSF